MPPKSAMSAWGVGIVFIAATASADEWTDYDDIGPDLLNYETTYPTLCERYDLGLSVQGRHLWALRISDNITLEEDEPEFRYIATMHGDEIVGTKMCMNLIDYLLTNYGTDPQATNIVDEIDLWIMPLMNPDGYDRSPRTRANANGIDLNRDFPLYGEPNSTVGREIETAHIMNWSAAHSFTLSANIHGGALVVNYPFDNEDTGSQYTPDNDLMIFISETYSYYNVPMWNGAWYHGITNGVDWYSTWGNIQDWNYLFEGCNDVTLEISNNKQPPASQIGQFWDDNRQSMLAYMETCLIGVRGLVTDANSGVPLAATVRVVGRDHDVFSDPDVGDYHRMLLPGTYDLEFEADGYDTMVVTGVQVNTGPATILDVAMSGPAQVTSPNGGEEITAGIETTVTWTGHPELSTQVQYTANYGDIGVTNDGFESGSLGPEYTTGGDADWYVTGGTVHSGSYAARAGDIGNNDDSWMTRTVSGGELSFWYRVSSEYTYDWFNFYIDGSREIHASGTTGGWTFYSTTLPPGSYELRWEYTKDGSQSHGSDTAWIDDLSISEDQTMWVDIIAETTPGATSTPWTPTTPGEDYKVRVRSLYDGGGTGLWDESDDTFTVVEGNACPADLTGDDQVNIDDIFAVLGLWGTCPDPCPPYCDGDLTQDCAVNIDDIFAILGQWGPCE